MVSKQGHCLIDMFWRWEAGELDAEIPLVISNHDDLAPKVEAHGIPFFHLPVTKESQAEQEARVEALLREHEIDLVVPARYMQILSPQPVGSSTSRSSTSITLSCQPSWERARTTRHTAEE